MEPLPSPAATHKKVVKPLASSLLAKYQDHLAKINCDAASTTSRPPPVKPSPTRKLAHLRLAQESKPQHQEKPKKPDEQTDKQDQQKQQPQKQQEQQQQKSTTEQEVDTKESPKQEVPKLEITENETPNITIPEKKTSYETLEKSLEQLEQETSIIHEKKPAASTHTQSEISQPAAEPVAEAIVEPVAEPVVEPVAEPVVEPEIGRAHV